MATENTIPSSRLRDVVAGVNWQAYRALTQSSFIRTAIDAGHAMACYTSESAVLRSVPRSERLLWDNEGPFADSSVASSSVWELRRIGDMARVSVLMQDHVSGRRETAASDATPLLHVVNQSAGTPASSVAFSTFESTTELGSGNKALPMKNVALPALPEISRLRPIDPRDIAVAGGASFAPATTTMHKVEQAGSPWPAPLRPNGRPASTEFKIKRKPLPNGAVVAHLPPPDYSANIVANLKHTSQYKSTGLPVSAYQPLFDPYEEAELGQVSTPKVVPRGPRSQFSKATLTPATPDVFSIDEFVESNELALQSTSDSIVSAVNGSPSSLNGAESQFITPGTTEPAEEFTVPYTAQIKPEKTEPFPKYVDPGYEAYTLIRSTYSFTVTQTPVPEREASHIPEMTALRLENMPFLPRGRQRAAPYGTNKVSQPIERTKTVSVKTPAFFSDESLEPEPLSSHHGPAYIEQHEKRYTAYHPSLAAPAVPAPASTATTPGEYKTHLQVSKHLPSSLLPSNPQQQQITSKFGTVSLRLRAGTAPRRMASVLETGLSKAGRARKKVMRVFEGNFDGAERGL